MQEKKGWATCSHAFGACGYDRGILTSISSDIFKKSLERIGTADRKWEMKLSFVSKAKKCLTGICDNFVITRSHEIKWVRA